MEFKTSYEDLFGLYIIVFIMGLPASYPIANVVNWLASILNIHWIVVCLIILALFYIYLWNTSFNILIKNDVIFFENALYPKVKNELKVNRIKAIEIKADIIYGKNIIKIKSTNRRGKLRVKKFKCYYMYHDHHDYEGDELTFDDLIDEISKYKGRVNVKILGYPI